MILTTEEIARLRELVAKATPGPWKTHLVDSTTIVSPSREIGTTCDSSNTERDDAYNVEYEQMENDAEAIAAAVNALPALLDTAERVAALEAENARLREALEPFAVDDPAWTGDGSLQIEMRAVDGVPQPCVTLADLRRARAALKGEGA